MRLSEFSMPCMAPLPLPQYRCGLLTPQLRIHRSAPCVWLCRVFSKQPPVCVCPTEGLQSCPPVCSGLYPAPWPLPSLQEQVVLYWVGWGIRDGFLRVLPCQHPLCLRLGPWA